MTRMATRVVVVAAACALATVTAAPARAQMGATASVEDQIKKMEKDRAAAVVKADVATLESLTSDDYILINANGQVSNKAETMNNIKTGVIKLTANEVSDLKVRVYGDTAVVTGKSSAKGTIGGRELKGPVMFTRVYVKKNGKWQSVAFQQTPIVAP
jgi:ketosteroid isomerase-like protein